MFAERKEMFTSDFAFIFAREQGRPNTLPLKWLRASFDWRTYRLIEVTCGLLIGGLIWFTSLTSPFALELPRKIDGIRFALLARCARQLVTECRSSPG